MTTTEASRAEANKAFIRQYLESFSGKPKPEEAMRDFTTSEALLEHINLFEAAFPRYELQIEDMIAEGDKVVVRMLARVTHGGEFFGIPATGRNIEIPGIVIYRIDNDKISEFWMQADVMSLMQQLGSQQ